MIYKFDEDGHGQVIAEEKNAALEPFLGLHYPASDIPKQARELYKINLTRIIANVDSENVPIISHLQNGPLDLTLSVLRSVSLAPDFPVHDQRQEKGHKILQCQSEQSDDPGIAHRDPPGRVPEQGIAEIVQADKTHRLRNPIPTENAELKNLKERENREARRIHPGR